MAVNINTSSRIYAIRLFQGGGGEMLQSLETNNLTGANHDKKPKCCTVGKISLGDKIRRDLHHD